MGNLIAFLQGKPNELIRAEELKKQARKELGLSTNHFNFAVIGHTKTGKSTLVNAFLKDKDAAKTGPCETTHQIKSYRVPWLNHVVLWDVPGAGTLSHKSKTYFKDNKLFAFDCVVILLEDFPTEDDLNYAIQATNAKQPVIFARSKCDINVYNAKQMDEESYEDDQSCADELIKKMRVDFVQEISKTKNSEVKKIKLFFISSKIMWDVMTKKPPKYHFQENEFIRELIFCASVARGDYNAASDVATTLFSNLQVKN